MSAIACRWFGLLAVVGVAACSSAVLRPPAGPFDPNPRFMILNHNWDAPPLDPATGLTWLTCDPVASEGAYQTVRNDVNSRIPLLRGHMLETNQGFLPGGAQIRRDFVLVLPRTTHVAVYAHARNAPPFQKKVRLTLDYGAHGCTVSAPDQLRIVRIDDRGDMTVLTTFHDAGTTTVYADLDHLSTFAIAR